MKGICPTWQPKTWASDEVFCGSTLIGTREDFKKLTFKPVEMAYKFRISFRLRSCYSSAGKIINVSSAYYIIGKSPPKLLPKGWCSIPVLAASLMIDWRRSAAITNNRGDKGSSCLTPLLHLNGLPGTPFSTTEEEPEARARGKKRELNWLQPRWKGGGSYYDDDTTRLLLLTLALCKPLKEKKCSAKHAQRDYVYTVHASSWVHTLKDWIV